MSWIKLDDQFADHPKFLDIRRQLLDAATSLWIRALGHCNKHKTDGLIVRGAVYHLSGAENPEAVADELVRVGLWETIDRGWLIHDYHVYQPRSEKAKAAKAEVCAARSSAGKRGAASRWGSDSKPMANGMANDSKPMANVMAIAIEADGKPMAPIPIPYPDHDPTDHVPAQDAPATLASGQVDPMSAQAWSGAPNDAQPAVHPQKPARGPKRAGNRQSDELPPGAYALVVDTYFAEFEKARGCKPTFRSKDGRHAKDLIACLKGAERAAEVIRSAFADPWWAEKKGSLADIVSDPNRFLGRPRFASGARAVAPRVDDRPEVYGETREDFDRRQRDARELREAIARGDVVVDPAEIARREEECPV